MVAFEAWFPCQCRSLLITITLMLIISTTANIVYLNGSYNENLYLNATNTSYHLIGHVNIGKNATLFIANGVEIFFEDNYSLKIYGRINSGCYHYDTQNIQNRGLADPSNHVTFRSNASSFNKFGYVYIKNPGKSGMFCNTKFMKLNIGIQFESEVPEQLIIDNCEFYDVAHALRVDIPVSFRMTDTVVKSVRYVNQLSSGIYDNCEFSGYYKFFANIGATYGAHSVSIVNSTLIAEFTKTALEILPWTNIVGQGIYNNVIRNALYGIHIYPSNDSNNQSVVYVGYNNVSSTIYGCGIGRSNVMIEGNVWENNTFDVILGNRSGSIEYYLTNISIINNRFMDNANYSIEAGHAIINELNISNNAFRSNGNDVHEANGCIRFLNRQSSQVYITYNQFVDSQSGIRVQNTSGIYVLYNSFINNTLLADLYGGLIQTKTSNDVNINYNTFIGNMFTASSTLYDSSNDLNIEFKGNNITNNIAEHDHLSFDVLKVQYATTVIIEYNSFNNLMPSNNTDAVTGSFDDAYFIRLNKVYGNISIQYNDFHSSHSSMTTYIIITNIGFDINSTPPTAKIRFNNFYVDSNHYHSVWLENEYDIDANFNYFGGLHNLAMMQSQGVLLDYCNDNVYGRINISNLFLTPINFINPDLSQLCILNPLPIQCRIDTWCFTSSPTSIPTEITISPTEEGTILIYGVIIELSFNYIVNESDTMIIKQIVANIINNTMVIESNNITVIDCIDDSESNFIVQSVNKKNGTFINATISICDESSQNIVLNAFSNGKLYRDVINKADEKGLVIYLKESSVTIVGDKIYTKYSQITTSIFSEKQSTINIVGNDEGNNDITNILIGIGSGLLICVLIICLICFYKMKTLDIENQNEQKPLEMKMYANRNRITSVSISHNNGDTESKSNIENMIANIDNDNTPSMEKEKDDNDDIIPDDDEKCIVSTTTTEGNADNNNNHDIDDDQENKLIMKQWLNNTVELAQYYHVFIENGFESLMFLKEIIYKQELQELGIENIEHQTKIINAIRELQNDENETNNINIESTTTEGLTDPNTQYQGTNNNEEFEILGDDQTNGTNK